MVDDCESCSSSHLKWVYGLLMVPRSGPDSSPNSSIQSLVGRVTGSHETEDACIEPDAKHARTSTCPSPKLDPVHIRRIDVTLEGVLYEISESQRSSLGDGDESAGSYARQG